MFHIACCISYLACFTVACSMLRMACCICMNTSQAKGEKQNKSYSCFEHVSYTCFGVAHALIAYCINHAGGTSVTICPQYVCDTKHALSNVLFLHTPALHNACQQVPRYQHHNVRPWRHIHSTDTTTYATLCVFCSNGIHLCCLRNSLANPSQKENPGAHLKATHSM